MGWARGKAGAGATAKLCGLHWGVVWKGRGRGVGRSGGCVVVWVGWVLLRSNLEGYGWRQNVSGKEA